MYFYVSNKTRSTIRQTFTKEKQIPGQKGGPGPPKPTPKFALHTTAHCFKDF